MKQKNESEYIQPTLSDMEFVRSNAETLARLIQTKVNFVKVLKG